MLVTVVLVRKRELQETRVSSRSLVMLCLVAAQVAQGEGDKKEGNAEVLVVEEEEENEEQ